MKDAGPSSDSTDSVVAQNYSYLQLYFHNMTN